MATHRGMSRDPFTGVQIRIGVMGSASHPVEAAVAALGRRLGRAVRAAVETIHGLSAHAAGDGLMRWLRTATGRPKRVFIVHGDPGPAQTLATRIRTELGWPTVIPGYRDRQDLD